MRHKHSFHYPVKQNRFSVLFDNLLEYALAYRSKKLSKVSFPHPAYIHAHDRVGWYITIEGYAEKPYIDYLKDRVLPELNVGNACLVDVGANIGNHSICLGSNFERVVSVEPAPFNFKLLRLNCPEPKYSLHNVGLLSKAGSARLVVVPTNSGGTMLVAADPGQSHAGQTIVETTTLDQLLESEPHVDVLKIDVEGAELEVLRGGVDTLKKFNPVVVFEQNAWDTKHADCTAASFLAELGYRFILLSGASLHDSGSKWHKMNLVSRLLFAGASIRVEQVSVVPSNASYPVVVAYK